MAEIQRSPQAPSGATGLKIDTAEFLRSAHHSRDFVRDDLPQVAFVGRSNVGKSSLMNRLLGRRSLAKTSSTPGRTRAVNYFLINRRLYFVDLPGYGYAKAGWRERQAWAELVEAYFHTLPARAQVVQLIDAKVGATELDLEASRYLAGFGVPSLVAATKIDRLARGRRRAALRAAAEALELDPGRAPVGVSARTGEGIPELWREIDRRLTAPP